MCATFFRYETGRSGRAADRMRGGKPFQFSNLKTGQGLPEIVRFIETQGMLGDKAVRAA